MMKSSFNCCPGRTRTPTYETKTRCPAIRRPGKSSELANIKHFFLYVKHSSYFEIFHSPRTVFLGIHFSLYTQVPDWELCIFLAILSDRVEKDTKRVVSFLIPSKARIFFSSLLFCRWDYWASTFRVEKLHTTIFVSRVLKHAALSSILYRKGSQANCWSIQTLMFLKYFCTCFRLEKGEIEVG